MVKSRKTGGALQTAAGNTPDRGGTPRERHMERLPRRMIERFAPGEAQLHPEQNGPAADTCCPYGNECCRLRRY